MKTSLILMVTFFVFVCDSIGDPKPQSDESVAGKEKDADDWSKPIPWLVRANEVRWEQLLAEPRKFNDHRFWIRGILAVKIHEGVVKIRIYPSTERKTLGDTGASCAIILDEKTTREFMKESSKDAANLDGKFVKIQGRFKSNPAYEEGGEAGQISPPIFVGFPNSVINDIVTPDR